VRTENEDDLAPYRDFMKTQKIKISLQQWSSDSSKNLGDCRSIWALDPDFANMPKLSHLSHFLVIDNILRTYTYMHTINKHTELTFAYGVNL
jgi:hypothetical protein